MFSRWAGHHAKAMDAAQQLDRQPHPRHPAAAARWPGNAAILGVGSLRIMHGEMSVGDLVAFASLAASASNRSGSGNPRGFGTADQGQSLRVSDVLAHRTDPRTARRDGDHRSGPARLEGTIELRGVTFGYNPNEPALIENFDLVVHPGQRIAIVGGSGSGKSTIARLICGLYPVWSGEILFDGRPIGEIPPSVLANSLAYVDQDVFCSRLRYARTLHCGTAASTGAALARALQDAASSRRSPTAPGSTTTKSPKAVDFSGGQRQRSK
jgi:ABC-type bacteriocin/lantibiotic exporter with double-glycine peptidase domain